VRSAGPTARRARSIWPLQSRTQPNAEMNTSQLGGVAESIAPVGAVVQTRGACWRRRKISRLELWWSLEYEGIDHGVRLKISGSP
jgi:hypothetical protein